MKVRTCCMSRLASIPPPPGPARHTARSLAVSAPSARPVYVQVWDSVFDLPDMFCIETNDKNKTTVGPQLSS